jgi:hypothetical protein
MNEYDQDLSAIFGPKARHSEYVVGQVVRYKAEGRIKTGEISWITPADDTHPLEYWIGLECLYSTDLIEAIEEEEPDTASLVLCPHCGRTHDALGVEWCRQKKERK